jgi:hypothetical protein
MKTTMCSALHQLGHNHHVGPRLDRARIVVELCVLVACGLAIVTVLADTAMGCKWPSYPPNPLCAGAPPPSTGCMKWLHNPAPSNCEGDPSYFVCFQFSASSTFTLWTRAAAPCGCAGAWTPSWSGPSPVNQAYNNDTQCYN